MSGKKILRDGRHLLRDYLALPQTKSIFSPVKEAHSHKDGDWYQRPKDYPVAYFDSDGYVIFHSEEELFSPSGKDEPFLNFSQTIAWVEASQSTTEKFQALVSRKIQTDLQGAVLYLPSYNLY